MPYIGVRRRSGNQNLIIKVHGPADLIPLDPKELKATIDQLILRHNDKPLSDLPRYLADDICNIFANGSDILWVTVELETANDVFYGSSAEKVNC